VSINATLIDSNDDSTWVSDLTIYMNDHPIDESVSDTDGGLLWVGPTTCARTALQKFDSAQEGNEGVGASAIYSVAVVPINMSAYPNAVVYLGNGYCAQENLEGTWSGKIKLIGLKACHSQSGSCTAINCPVNSSGTNVPTGCTCDAGFSGTIVATQSSPYYSGSCTVSSSTTTIITTVAPTITTAFGTHTTTEKSGIDTTTIDSDETTKSGSGDIKSFNSTTFSTTTTEGTITATVVITDTTAPTSNAATTNTLTAIQTTTSLDSTSDYVTSATGSSGGVTTTTLTTVITACNAGFSGSIMSYCDEKSAEFTFIDWSFFSGEYNFAFDVGTLIGTLTEVSIDAVLTQEQQNTWARYLTLYINDRPIINSLSDTSEGLLWMGPDYCPLHANQYYFPTDATGPNETSYISNITDIGTRVYYSITVEPINMATFPNAVVYLGNGCGCCDSNMKGTWTGKIKLSGLKGCRSHSGSCTAINCPANSSGADVPTGCTCDAGFSGEIIASLSSPNYFSGSCVSSTSATTIIPTITRAFDSTVDESTTTSTATTTFTTTTTAFPTSTTTRTSPCMLLAPTATTAALTTTSTIETPLDVHIGVSWQVTTPESINLTHDLLLDMVECKGFTMALVALIPGVFAENIDCREPVLTSTNDWTSSKVIISAAIYTVSEASVAIVSYLNNITANGDLAVHLRSDLVLENYPGLMFWQAPRVILPSNCSSPIVCEPEYFQYNSEQCTYVCESLVQKNYRLDYGIYLLKLRAYEATSKKMACRI